MNILPITGSWFEFKHCGRAEGKYWNIPCREFSPEQWRIKLREIAELGLDTLVLMHVALEAAAFYDSKIFPDKVEFKTDNAVEILLDEADNLGLSIFVGNGFWGNWFDFQTASDAKANIFRMDAIKELQEKFGHHKSFVGWYWPDEACINPVFPESFMKYVNMQSELARKLDPAKKTLIAPYGTNKIIAGDTNYIEQLKRLDVDYIAYQDEIGVQKTQLDELEGIWKIVADMHEKVPERKLWADVEVFEFEGDVYKSALLPAPVDRIEKQLQVASKYVEKILVYQYQGMFNKPGSQAFAGHPDSAKLYEDYKQMLQKYDL